MAAKKDIVVFQFPTLEELLSSGFFGKVEITGKYTMICMEDDINNNELKFPMSYAGKKIEFSKEDDSYMVVDKNIPAGEREVIYCDEIPLLYRLCKHISGQLLMNPIVIQGDNLIYESEDKQFKCGCKIISLEKADEIFRYIGGILGYEIT